MEQAARAESVMEPGPSTTRPDIDPHELRAKLEAADLTTAVLTDPEGRLLGIVRRDDLPAATSSGTQTPARAADELARSPAGAAAAAAAEPGRAEAEDRAR